MTAAPFALRPVPWAFINHDLMKVWIWRTEHFEAKVTADANSFLWEIVDFINSPDGIFLTEGRCRDFNEAENEVRETIGKSYPPKYGYGPYAGVLATTFTIATGERVDFGRYAGDRAVITVRLPNGIDQIFVGSVRVHHYEVRLTLDSQQTVSIQPSHVVKVVGEAGGQRRSARTDYTGMGRTYTGTVQRGCNGRAGFLPDTIDHSGALCPIHEDTGPRL